MRSPAPPRAKPPLSAPFEIRPPRPDAPELWQAFKDGRLLAGLRVHRPHSRLCLLLPPTDPGEDDEEAGAALIEAARQAHAAVELQALCWRRPEHARFIARLERLGFRLREEKVYVQRGLEGWRSPWPDPFTYASLADAGEVVFIETLAGMVEPSTADPADAARREFADFLEMAGAAFDPARWLLALVDGQPAGLALPQPFPDGPAEGTLFWVGLLPEWRGRGWGRALHGRGLEELERAGVRRYVGSTAVDNAAMRRVFALNGCEEQGMRITYVQPGTA